MRRAALLILAWLLAITPVFAGATDFGANSITLQTPLAVTSGGLGVASPTSHAVLIGAGSSPVNPATVGTNGQLFIGQTGADPAFKTMSGDATITSNGLISVTSATSLNASSITSGILSSARLQPILQWLPPDQNSSVQAIGISSLNTTSATPVQQTGTDGNSYTLSTYTTLTGIGNNKSQYGPTANDLAFFGSGPIFTTIVSLGRLTGCRVWIGLIPTIDATSNTDTPGPDVISFRFSTAAGDTNYETYTSSHTSVNSAVDTGVAPNLNQPDILTIDATNLASVKFYVNGVLKDTRTTNLPDPTATFVPFVQFVNLTNGVAMVGYNGYMSLTHR